MVLNNTLKHGHFFTITWAICHYITWNARYTYLLLK